MTQQFLPNFNQETTYPLVPGAVYHFETILGNLYSIIIEDVTDTEVTMRNTRDGCMALTVSHKAAYDILENCSSVTHPIGFYS